MKLRELQRAMQAHVLHGAQEIAAEVLATQRFDIPTRLGVYGQGYAERLIEALAITYPAVQEALGRASFALLVRELAHRAPSRSFSVRHYGRELSESIAMQLTGTRGRGAAELARFEWALAHVFDARDAPRMLHAELEHLAAARWPRLVLRTVPAVQIVTLTTNAVRWWRAACAGAPRPRQWRSQRAQQWLLWRRELAVYFRPLAGDEARALEALQQGRTFGLLCEQLATSATPERAAARAATLLRTWIEEGLLLSLAAAA